MRQRGFEIVEKSFRKNPEKEIVMPLRGTKKSAGYDICTPVDIEIEPNGVSKLIFTDIKSYMLDDEVLTIHVRSSVGIKKGLVLANVTGIIDADYYSNESNDGNIGFKLRNLSDKKVVIKAGERVVQAIFIKYLTADNDKNTVFEHRTGGVGSTNK